MSYIFYLLTTIEIYVIIALSLNLLVGYCGLITLAHAAYFALGAYAYALATMGWSSPFLVAMGFAALVGMVLSTLISIPASRVRGDFFVVISLAVQALISSLLKNWYTPGAELFSLKNLTNGSHGIAGIPKPFLFGIVFDDSQLFFYLTTVITVLCMALCYYLFQSPWGRLLKAIRDDELAARNLGKFSSRAKVQAFALACALVSVAGALYSAQITFINPNIASLDHSILMLCMIIVGGLGNFRGPIVGAVTLLLIPEALSLIELPSYAVDKLRLLTYGFLLISIVHFRPQGIAGNYRFD